MLRLAVPALLSLLQLACVVSVRDGGSGEKPADQDEGSKPNGVTDPGVTDPEASNPEVADPEAEGEPPARAGTPQLPDCPADADADTYCTEDGKLAGRWVPVDTLRPPESAQTVFEAAPADIEKQPSLTILLDGETLYIKKVTCGNCRRVIGWGFSGDLTALSDEQLRKLQTKLGFGREPQLLDSAEAWRSYAATDPGKATLNRVAATTD
jgi:hypothetical protein